MNNKNENKNLKLIELIEDYQEFNEDDYFFEDIMNLYLLLKKSNERKNKEKINEK